ncbi:WXG100 family type VII secretion target [Streptomyces sp. SID14478]|uniref:WXG100 family type VII secretion target n=1 Tax=Streptomyces sp. SID14478 TaxID=2706073 RepID=UPI0013DB40EC|nr:WXG100 family type VII secretion target [Streptomyces sp. SID14478]NEB73720.1 WXG100 family type VII secretion target [Streptomyces sp. SID14478]
MGRNKDLAAKDEDLTKLADDLDAMQDHLTRQVTRMDRVVDEVEEGWQGPAAVEYRKLHRSVAEDAVRIRDVMKKLEEAVRLSRDGFTATELDVLARMRAVEVDVDAEADRLSTPSEPPPARPRSGLDQL